MKPTAVQVRINRDQALRLLDALESVHDPLPLSMSGAEGAAAHDKLTKRVQKALARFSP